MQGIRSSPVFVGRLEGDLLWYLSTTLGRMSRVTSYVRGLFYDS